MEKEEKKKHKNPERDLPTLGTFIGPTLGYLDISLILNLLDFNNSNKGWKTIAQIKDYDIKLTKNKNTNYSKSSEHPYKNPFQFMPTKKSNERNFHPYLNKFSKIAIVEMDPPHKNPQGKQRDTKYKLYQDIFTIRYLYMQFSILDAAVEFYKETKPFSLDNSFIETTFSYNADDNTATWARESRSKIEIDVREKLKSKGKRFLKIHDFFSPPLRTSEAAQIIHIPYLATLARAGVLLDDKEIPALGKKLSQSYLFLSLEKKKFIAEMSTVVVNAEKIFKDKEDPVKIRIFFIDALFSSDYYKTLPDDVKQEFKKERWLTEVQINSIPIQHTKNIKEDEKKFFEEYAKKYDKKGLIT